MNVEHNQAAAHQGRSVSGAHAKGKSSGPAAPAEAPSEGDFMSLLALLSGDEGEGLQEAVLAETDGIASEVPAATGVPQDGTLATTLLAADGAVASAGADASVPVWAAAAVQAPRGQPAEGTAPAAEGLPIPGADMARPGEARAAPAGDGLPARPASVNDHGLKIGQDEALRDQPGPLGRAVAELMQAQAPGKSLSTKAAVHATAGALPNSVAEAASHAKAQLDNVKVELSSAVSAATEQALTSFPGSPVMAERRGDKAADPGTRFVGDAAWNRPALMPGNGVEVPAASADASVGDPGRQMAEQVSYWIANGVENAEFKLDKFGDSPVEVSISLQGKEARVEFRTDMQEMRQVLQNAVTQLKDMLQSQGLVLAGVSVGGSGADASGQREPPPARAPVRQAVVAVPQAVVASLGTARAAPGVGRALDIFV